MKFYWMCLRLTLLLLLGCSLSVTLAFGLARLAPPRSQLYILSWPPGDQLSIMMFDIDYSLSVPLLSEPFYTDFGMMEWALSPDGKQVVLQSPYNLTLMDIRGYDQRWLRSDSMNPSWSPDGTKIAFASSPDSDNNYEIYVMDADGSNEERLTVNDVFDGSPAWSPDGQRIAFVSFQGGDAEIDAEIYVMNSDGTHQHPLTINDYQDITPDWSADGRQIVFGSTASSPATSGQFQLHIMNSDGSDQHLLLATQDSAAFPLWSPDGEYIVFQEKVSNYSSTYIMNSDGSNLRLVAYYWGGIIFKPLWASPWGT